MTLRATCCCGRLSLSAEGEPAINALCHCDDCKRRTGSAFGWSLYFREEQVELPQGGYRLYSPASGNGQERGYCDQCGSTLFWRFPPCPGMIGVAGGNFERGSVPEPDASYSDGKRCSWLTVPEHWALHG